jgi:hypothetical protein
MGRRWTARAAVGATYRRLARKFMHRSSKRERPFYAAVGALWRPSARLRALLSRPSVQTMATGQLIPGQKAVSGLFPGDGETRSASFCLESALAGGGTVRWGGHSARPERRFSRLWDCHVGQVRHGREVNRGQACGIDILAPAHHPVAEG